MQPDKYDKAGMPYSNSMEEQSAGGTVSSAGDATTASPTAGETSEVILPQNTSEENVTNLQDETCKFWGCRQC